MTTRVLGTQRVEWIERMRSVSVLDAGRALGLEVQPPKGSNGGAFACPACSAPRRHTKTRDKRAAAGVRKDGIGWRCFQCGESGDALDLVAFAVRGERFPKLSDAGKAEVRERCVQLVGSRISHVAADTRLRLRPRPMAETAAPTIRLPVGEVAAVWNSAARVDSDDAVSAWLRDERALDPALISKMDLARVLRADASALPRWTGYGGENDKPWRSWPSAGLRLVLPMFDAIGDMRSLAFRRSFETERAWPPKSMAVNGFARTGLVMANAVGRHLLEHPVARAAGMSIVIEEGETDWLTACLAWARHDERAVFGVVTGSWSADLAARIPRAARVTIRTDTDAAGDTLAAPIIESLRGRCTVLRAAQKQV